MTTKSKLKGSLNISGMHVPVDTPLPPATLGDFKFVYKLPDDTPPTDTASVTDFLSWAENNLNLPADFQTYLPTSLTKLSLGVSSLEIDTSGIFNVGVLFGSGTGGTWSPSWKPIDGLPFSFDNIELKVEYSKT